MQLQEMQRSFSRFSMAKKERLDKILVDLGYFETKSKASSAILAEFRAVFNFLITSLAQHNPTPLYDYLYVIMFYFKATVPDFILKNQ